MSSDAPLRRLARDIAAPVAESVWGAAAYAAGWCGGLHRRPRPLATTGKQRVVIVAPHPDDETIGAGGAAALHARAGDSVTVIVVSDGGASRAGGLDRTAMAALRRRELAAAMSALGLDPAVTLGLPESCWDATEAAAPLRAAVNAAHVVYAPSHIDYHPEHIAVARVLASVLAPTQRVRCYEIGVPLTPLLANVVLDVSDVVTQRDAALAAYASQAATIAAARRLHRYQRRFYGRPVELFWELSGAAYTRVTAAADSAAGPNGGRSPYRGIRHAPWTDPLVVAGLRARHRLARAAAA